MAADVIDKFGIKTTTGMRRKTFVIGHTAQKQGGAILVINIIAGVAAIQNFPTGGGDVREIKFFGRSMRSSRTGVGRYPHDQGGKR